MGKKPQEKVTTVRQHPRHVPASEKNPDGITIVDRHLRRLKGTYLDPDDIKSVFDSYNREGLIWPASGKLNEHKNSDKYDELIAVWTDYFNRKLKLDPPLDSDVVKALIASESDFHMDPPGNKFAIGIAQITKATLKILQDSEGEAKDFIFKDISQKDLKDPSVAIPMATRWLCRKMETARNKLGRAPNAEELILEYKGLLKSDTRYKQNAFAKFKKAYDALKNK